MNNMQEKYDFWWFENVLSHENLVEIHHMFNRFKVAHIDDPANTTKKVNITTANWFNLKLKLNFIEQMVFQTNSQAFGYNIWPQYDQQLISLNEYDSKVKGEYDWHYDGSKNPHSDIKLTVLINASLEDYEGGKFYLFNNKPFHIEQLDKPGNIVMFKSHCYHKVEPVKKGKRHSISLWYYGPRFA